MGSLEGFSVTPSRQDLDVWSGNTFRIVFQLKEANADPYDLTGLKLVFRAVSATATIRKDTDDGTGLSITNALNGEVTLFLSVEETRSLPAGKVRYELELWAGVDQTSLLYGELNVTVWVNDDVDP